MDATPTQGAPQVPQPPPPLPGGVFSGFHRWDEQTVLGSGSDKIAEIQLR